MARQGITFEQVAAVADALAGEGQQPTIRAVRRSWATPAARTLFTST